jgi:hypothetical protein
MIKALPSVKELTDKIGPSAHWASLWNPLGSRSAAGCLGFIGLTARFSILPYLKAKALQHQKSVLQRATVDMNGILQSAIFGEGGVFSLVLSNIHLSSSAPLTSSLGVINVEPTDDVEQYRRRLDVVRFLISIGADQKYIYGLTGRKTSLRKRVQQRAEECGVKDLPNGQAYYIEVSQLLGTRSSMLKSATMLLKSLKP